MNSTEPLGLPAGSVRAMLSFLVIGASIAMHAFLPDRVPASLDSMAELAFGLYFGARIATNVVKNNA